MLKPYNDNVEIIKNEVHNIGQAVIHANKIALSALKENDLSMLKDVNLSIKKLSIKSNEIDNLIVKTLALYSPEARDLREMVSYLK
jgi:phosphate transport system protein